MHMNNKLYRLLWLPILATLFGYSLNAQIEQSTTTTEVGFGGSAPFNEYDNNIGIRLLLQTEVFHKDTYVVLDYAQQEPVWVARPVFESLAFGEDETTLKFLGEDFSLEISQDDLRMYQGPFFSELTYRNEELNETIDVTIKLGWPVLKHFSLKLDFENQQLILTPAAERTYEDVVHEYQMVVQGLREIDNQVQIPVLDKDDNLHLMAFDIMSYHTRIDADFAKSVGHQSGDVPGLRFFDGEQTLPISEMAALKPVPMTVEPVNNQGTDTEVVEGEAPVFDAEVIGQEPTLVTGFSLLSGYTLEVNPQQRFLALTQTKNSNVREEDAELYAAFGAQDRHLFDQYLEKYPEDRHVEEAVLNRFSLGLDAEDPSDVQMAALEKGLHVKADQDKFVFMNNFVGMAHTRQADRELRIDIGERALDFVAFSTTPSQRQLIQLYLGDLYLEKDDVETAWSYYLSGSFNGDPRGEMVVKYKLATVYEKQGRWRRAYANYARALRGQADLPEEMAIGSQEGLTRIREHLDPDDPLIKEAEEARAFVTQANNLGEPLEIVQAKNLAGEDVALDDYLGKVVLIDVWATWCGPCIAGIPKLRDVAKRFEGSDFVILSVSADAAAETVTDFLEDTPMPWDHWHIGASGEVHNTWNIRGYPTYMLIDKEGTLLARGHGLTDAMITQIEENIEQI